MKVTQFTVNTTLVLVAVVTSFAVLEGIVRVFMPTQTPEFSYSHMWQPHPTRAYQMVPNLQGSYEWNGKTISFETNSLGMRDVEIGAKGKSQRRILVLGDSFTWGGNGLNPSETFVKIVEKKLRSRVGDVIVMNAGHGGYGTKHQYEFLREHFDALDPDVVVIQFYNGNDFGDNIGLTDMVVLSGVRVYRKRLREFGESGTIIKGIIYLMEHSHLARLVFNEYFSGRYQRYVTAISGKSANRDFPDDDLPQVFSLQDKSLLNTLRKIPLPSFEHAYIQTFKEIERIRSFNQARNVETVLLVIPHQAQVNPARWRKLIERYELDRKAFNFSTPENRLEDFCRVEDMRCVFLLDSLRRVSAAGRQLYWESDPHLNEAGNEFVAEALFPILQELVNNREAMEMR